VKVLQLGPRLPFPPDDGGKIGILGITTALLDLGHALRLGGFDEEGLSARFGDALGRRLDAWFVEGVPAWRLRWSQVKVAAGVGTYLRDKYWSPSFARQAELSERAEIDMFGGIDCVVSISRIDTALILRQCPSARVYEMPAGYALNDPAPLRPGTIADPRLCFVGSFDGFVPRVKDVTDAVNLAVVPVRIGGGIRVKILDLLSRGVPAAISTSMGAEGTRVEHEGTNVVALADDAAQFVAQIARLASDPSAHLAMSEEGRRLIAAQYDWHPLVSGYCDWAASLPVRRD